MWSSASPRSALVWARGLATNVRALRHVIPKVVITPLGYATRAHEILEDAARDLLSGVDLPWSQEGVLATAAGLQATQEVINTLRPLLDGREDAVEVANPPTNCTQDCQAQNQVRGRLAVLGAPFPVPAGSRLTPRTAAF